MDILVSSPLWAVHVSDGVLSGPWLVLGFVVAGLLALLASWRIREEEIPRVALLTAAFFVASSIHVKLGPTSVHLLLNGLVGVVLGWRAPLAILVGVTLQALLIPHGGLTTIGVNATVEMLPALASALLFPPLLAVTRSHHPGPRSLLVAVSVLVWGGCLVLGVAVLATNPWRDLIRYTKGAGLVVSVDNLAPALAILLHPATGAGLGLLAVVLAWLERRMGNAPEFPAGACIGGLAVLGTTLLVGLILLADGAERWGTFASAVFLAHVPLALIEGLILGVTVGFLARVKPEMLPGAVHREHSVSDRLSLTPATQPVSTLALLALTGVLASTGVARAHRLEAEPRVDREKKQVRVESWYETGDPPAEATARVLRADGSILIQGPLDAKGVFVFSYDRVEPLQVVISAPGGHRARFQLSAADLGGEERPAVEGPSPTSTRGQDLLLGLTFLLALAAFVLSWRNNVRLRALSRTA